MFFVGLHGLQAGRAHGDPPPPPLSTSRGKEETRGGGLCNTLQCRPALLESAVSSILENAQ